RDHRFGRWQFGGHHHGDLPDRADHDHEDDPDHGHPADGTTLQDRGRRRLATDYPDGREFGSRPFYLDEPAAKDLFPSTFSRVAHAYKRRLDEVMARGEARGGIAVIDWVHPVPGKRILDLACGPGTLSYPIAKSVSPDGEVVGIDLAAGMIEIARREAPPGLLVRFELMDMADLRFPDHSF